MSISISTTTVDALKNFLSINKSINIKPGNVLSTVSVNKTIMGRYEVEENFPCEVPIYDLSVFIGALGLCQSPELDFDNSNCLVIKDSTTKSKSKIYYSDPDLITTAPDKELELPPTDVSFTLSWENLSRLQRASSTYGVQDLCLYGAEGSMYMCVTDKKNDTSNVYSIELGETDSEFCHCFKMENLKLMPNHTYNVSIHAGKVAHFKSTSCNLKYWIALEPNLSK
jgi:hypothetical protein